MNKNAITQKQQDHLTKICKYCGGTGVDVFNKKEVCPNCILPYQVVETPNETIPDEVKEKCTLCRGTGEIHTPNGEDDYFVDACDECDGRGWNIKECIMSPECGCEDCRKENIKMD